MCAVGEGIEPNRLQPGSEQSCLLAGRYRLRTINSARKERLALGQFLVLEPQSDSLSGVFRDLKLDGLTSFPLQDSRSGSNAPIQSNVVDSQGNKITDRSLLLSAR